jgi:hypothetical protein
VGDYDFVQLGSKERGVEERRAKRSGHVIGVKRHQGKYGSLNPV